MARRRFGKADHSGNGCGGVSVGLVFFLAGVGCLLFLGNFIVDYLNARSWVETPARILHAKLTTHNDTDSDGQPTTHYSIDTSYEYEYEGKSLKGTKVDLQVSQDGDRTAVESRLKEIEACLQENRPFRCYVNPDNPAEAVLYRSFHFGLMFGLTVLGLAFALVGFGLTWWGWRNVGKAHKQNRLASEHSAEPWLWRPDWAAGRIPAESSTFLGCMLAASALWILVSVPITMLTLQELIAGSGLAMLGLFFPVSALILVVFALDRITRRVRFGIPVFEMASVPGTVGGTLEGFVVLKGSPERLRGARLTLNCVNLIKVQKSRFSNEVDIQRTELWEDTTDVAQGAMVFEGGFTQIPVRFVIPSKVRETNGEVEDDKISWHLELKVKTKSGNQWGAGFEVPVFVCGESQGAVVESWRENDEGVDLQETLRSSKVKVAHVSDDSLKLVFPMGRNLLGATVAFFFTIPWLGGVLWLKWSIMGIVFAVIVAILIWSMLYCLFYGGWVEVADQALTTCIGYFGLGTKRRIKPGRITDFTVVQSGAFYSVHANLASGKKHTVAWMLRSRKAADVLVLALKHVMGMPY